MGYETSFARIRGKKDDNIHTVNVDNANPPIFVTMNRPKCPCRPRNVYDWFNKKLNTMPIEYDTTLAKIEEKFQEIRNENIATSTALAVQLTKKNEKELAQKYFIFHAPQSVDLGENGLKM